jgi:hypothetical protein
MQYTTTTTIIIIGMALATTGAIHAESTGTRFIALAILAELAASYVVARAATR